MSNGGYNGSDYFSLYFRSFFFRGGRDFYETRGPGITCRWSLLTPERRTLSSSNYLNTRVTFSTGEIIALHIRTVFLLLLIRPWEYRYIDNDRSLQRESVFKAGVIIAIPSDIEDSFRLTARKCQSWGSHRIIRAKWSRRFHGCVQRVLNDIWASRKPSCNQLREIKKVEKIDKIIKVLIIYFGAKIKKLAKSGVAQFGSREAHLSQLYESRNTGANVIKKSVIRAQVRY